MDMHSAGLAGRPLEIKPGVDLDVSEGDQRGGEEHINFHHPEKGVSRKQREGVFDGIKPETPEEELGGDTSFF